MSFTQLVHIYFRHFVVLTVRMDMEISVLRDVYHAQKSEITRRRLRVLFLVVLVLCSGVFGYAALTGITTATREDVPKAPPTENYTVITESARFGTIIAYAPNGSVHYYNNTHTKYFDVDPVKNTSMTVEYTVTDTIHTRSSRCQSPPCARNAIERVNLTTGNVTEIYARYVPEQNAAEWHDADRINGTHVVLADMVDDEVYMIDTETGMIEWTWEAQSEYPVAGGGPYPRDWAHINDVEVLDDGRVMVSLRNQDQVVFVDPQTGLQEEWTLGEDGNHDKLYEQHNPDYIPEERGGPAVVVADSENGRILEFQRENGTWNRTWMWSDTRMQWPRDADRLPNGNTLITDTNGKRVIEVNQTGEIVWQVPLSHPYEAERLETGDESASGRSAKALSLESQIRDGDSERGYDFSGFGLLLGIVRDMLPSRITNAIIYVSPTWIGPSEVSFVIIAAITGVTWAGLECWWFFRSCGIGVQLPVYRREE